MVTGVLATQAVLLLIAVIFFIVAFMEGVVAKNKEEGKRFGLYALILLGLMQVAPTVIGVIYAIIHGII